MLARAWIVLSLLLSGTLLGYTFIPYDLRLIGEDGRSFETYAVRVILADYYARFFGAQDPLHALLLRNYYPNDSKFISRYLKRAQKWYLNEIAKYPKIYGKNVSAIVKGVEREEPPDDGVSSFIVIVQKNKAVGLEDEVPIALQRVSMVGPDGLLPEERHFLNKGLGGPLPTDDVTSGWFNVPLLEQSGFGHFRIVFPPRERKILWVKGGKLEIKHYCLDPDFAEKIFGHLWWIGIQHKFLVYSGERIPDSEAQKLGIETASQENLGMLAETGWTASYEAESPILARLYERFGTTHYKTIQNVHTGDVKLNFRPVRLEMLRQNVLHMIANRHQQFGKQAEWLVYDREMAQNLRASTCANELLSSGKMP
ncbi:MAG: hypothetical protein HY537_16870 [Deltaproteobacteria bacterium]|nr:hypothetical protein [Deltaproteobacteria bacterium]